MSFNRNASTSSAYMMDSIDLWHARLGHVNMSYVKKMKELGLIHNITDFSNIKCEVCVESKSTKKSCKTVERESELLGLIHTDLGDLKNTMTRGGKNIILFLWMTTLDILFYICLDLKMKHVICLLCINLKLKIN